MSENHVQGYGNVMVASFQNYEIYIDYNRYSYSSCFYIDVYEVSKKSFMSFKFTTKEKIFSILFNLEQCSEREAIEIAIQKVKTILEIRNDNKSENK